MLKRMDPYLEVRVQTNEFVEKCWLLPDVAHDVLDSRVVLKSVLR
ncbi:MAG: hypothetical protein RIS82_95 [Actinomycetota bacterium]